MFENPRRGRQARNFTTNAPKILDLKSSAEQIFSRKLPLGAPVKTFFKPFFQDEEIYMYRAAKLAFAFVPFSKLWTAN